MRFWLCPRQQVDDIVSQVLFTGSKPSSPPSPGPFPSPGSNSECEASPFCYGLNVCAPRQSPMLKCSPECGFLGDGPSKQQVKWGPRGGALLRGNARELSPVSFPLCLHRGGGPVRTREKVAEFKAGREFSAATEPLLDFDVGLPASRTKWPSVVQAAQSLVLCYGAWASWHTFLQSDQTIYCPCLLCGSVACILSLVLIALPELLHGDTYFWVQLWLAGFFVCFIYFYLLWRELRVWTYCLRSFMWGLL